MNTEKIKVGVKVIIDPFSEIKSYGFESDAHYVVGAINYVNVPHKWFSVTYGEHNLKKCYKFSDVGGLVRVCDGTENCPCMCTDEDCENAKIRFASDLECESLVAYIRRKIDILRDFRITPSRKEKKELYALKSEVAVDRWVKAYMKSRWEQEKRRNILRKRKEKTL